MHVAKKSAIVVAMLMILTVFSSMNAAASQGTLPNNSWSDNGWDSDGNGLYDKLNVTIHVNVTIAGDFRIQSYLFDGNLTTQIDVNILDINLNVGNNSVLLQFRGEEIRDKGFDGPYNVSVSLYDNAITFQDNIQFNTSAYTFIQFDRYPLEYTGIHSDYAFNTDVDSRFDILRVNTTYNVWKNGTYRLIGYLYDPAGTVTIDTFPIDDFYATIGTLQLDFDFEGMKIFTSGYDGQYRIKVSWYTQAGMYWHNEPIFQTINTYNHIAFQPPGCLVTMMTEQAIDTDGDAFFDELSLVFHVEVEVPGAYGIYAIVNHGTEVGRSAENIGDYYEDPGNYTISCSLNVGYKIDQEPLNASFVATVYARQYSNGGWSELGIRTFTTATKYNSTDFARKITEGIITGVPEYDFVDHDADGKYDWIDATVNVSCRAENSFIMYSYLRDYSSWETATQDRAEIDAINGTVQAHLRLPAWPVNSTMIDSPYRIDVRLYSNDMMQELSTSFDNMVPGSYNWTDFNGTKPIEFVLVDDYGIDNDGDGKYDTLAVQGNLIGHMSGLGQVYANLMNATMMVGPYSWYGSYHEGEETPILLYYSGITIRKMAIEPPFHLEMTYYSEDGDSFDFGNVNLLHVYALDMFEDPEHTLVIGKIIDEDTGNPVSGAAITGISYVWGSNATTTNSTGDFKFNLTSGLVSIAISKSGYGSRTNYFEATGTSIQKTLGITQSDTADSKVRGFAEFKDGTHIPAKSAIKLLNIGDYTMAGFEVGPNGFFDIPARAGPVILQFGTNLPEYGSVRLNVPAASTIWHNYTMQFNVAEGEEFDLLFEDWNHGAIEYTYNIGSYSGQRYAMQADFLYGDSNGIVSAEEARISALKDFNWLVNDFFDTSRMLLVNNVCYLYNTSRRTVNLNGMLGAIENIGPMKFVLISPFESLSDLSANNSKSIKIGAWYDSESEDWGLYDVKYRLQLPSSLAVTSYSAPADISVSGTTLVSIDPGIPDDSTISYAAVILKIGFTTEEPQTGSIKGLALLSSESYHGEILIEILNKNGDKVASTFTDTTGAYAIIGLANGDYVAKATKSGYYPAGSSVNVAGNLRTLDEIVLYLATTPDFVGSLNGTVVDETSNPIIDATVVIWYLENDILIGSFTTGSDGEFGISNLIPGAIGIDANAEGYLPYEDILFINGQEVLELTLMLIMPSGGITGRIVDDQGMAHEGVVLKLYNSTGHLVATTTTSANGNFTFENVLDGTYNISILWNDKIIGNITDIVVSNGTIRDSGTTEVPASAFAVYQDYTIFIIAAAAIIALILGILWFMKRPPAKKESKIEVLRAEKGVAIEREDEEIPQSKRRKS